MRHLNKGRKLGRNPSHQRALLKNLIVSILLTERDAEHDDNAPKTKGRIITTLPKAKEVRPLLEKCITIAKKAQKHINAAAVLETKAARNSTEWKKWRESAQWQEWNKAVSPALAARRRVLQIIGNHKEAVRILFDVVAPRFEDRSGGYTRILKLFKPRLGDAGKRAVLEFVGNNDRTKKRTQKPQVE
ncbi:MAG: 50S ribosomal protein L17 [Planctomycetaceae bacterium]|jgi:large subunit ribosomal protein L17|nr:50S ribosomal protein L17 [Planctomycetaceae bacterium]